MSRKNHQSDYLLSLHIFLLSFYSSSSSSSTTTVFLAGLRLDGPLTRVFDTGFGFSSSSSWASVKRSLYQSALKITNAFSISLKKNIYIIICRNLPFWDLTSPITSLHCVIEGLAKLTAITTWHISIYANVEELTIVRIGVSRMSQSVRFVYFWAAERKDFCNS